MRLLVLSPQDSGKACLGVLVREKRDRKRMPAGTWRCTLGDMHRHGSHPTHRRPPLGTARHTHNIDEAQRRGDPKQTDSMLGRQEIQLGMSPHHEAPPSGAHTRAQEPCPAPGPSHSLFPAGSECSSTGLRRWDPRYSSDLREASLPLPT